MYSYGGINYGFTWSNDFWHCDSKIQIGKCFGLLCFGLAVNCLVPSSYVSMQHPERIHPIISISIIFALSLYVAMGMLGLVTFNKVEGGINEFIMLNIPHESPFFYTSSGVLCAMLILITPIIVYPSSLTIDAWAQACCGKKEETEKPLIENQQTEVTVTEEVPKKESIFINDMPGVIARIAPLLVMTILAIVWPKFGNVVSIVGASATSLVSYIFPTMIHFKLFRKERKGLAVLDVVLTAFGICAAILGTILSVF